MIEYTTLGNLIAPAKVIRCGKGAFPVLSMTMHDGIVLQSERFKKSLASIDQSDYKVVKRGQLVVGFPIDEGVLYVQKAADEGIMSPAYNVWDIDTEKIDADFLELCLHSPQSMQYYKDKLRGTTARRRSIPTADLLTLKIRLPDMQTQREAVAIMRKAEAVIAARQEQLNSFEQLVKSRFIELFGEPLSNTKGWQTMLLVDAAPIKSRRGDLADEIWLLNLDAVEAQTGTVLFKHRVQSEEINASTVYFTTENVLYSKLRPYLNKVVMPDEDGVATSEMIPMYPLADRLNRAYLCYWLRSDAFVKHISEKVSGAKMPRVSMDYFRSLSIELPPLGLQEQFAAFVEQTDKSKLCGKMEVAA
mgnify:CR=1 FL=1